MWKIDTTMDSIYEFDDLHVHLGFCKDQVLSNVILCPEQAFSLYPQFT